MNGTAHTIIGAAAGLIVANTIGADSSDALILSGLGAISALVPDLDIDGKLRNKITFSHKVIASTAKSIGILMVFYSFLNGSHTDRLIGFAIGIGMFLLSTWIKQKHMLTITGIGVMLAGFVFDETWMMLMGSYIIIASFLSHRSYTHSLIGVIFFAIIASTFQTSIEMNGVFTACVSGYISHLIADMKILPFNKRGIKLFLPFSGREI